MECASAILEYLRKSDTGNDASKLSFLVMLHYRDVCGVVVVVEW